MTGAEIKRQFEQDTDTAYSGYYDNTTLNRFFKKGLINAIEQIYLNRLNNQNAYDEINYLIVTDQLFTLNNNQIYLSPLTITNVTIGGAFATITTELPHNLVAGDTLTTSGVVGFTPPLNYTNTTVAAVTNIFTFTILIPATVGTYTANTGLVTPANSISDYFHYFFGLATFRTPTTYVVSATTNTTPIKMTLNKRSFFRSGEQALISGIAGNTNANGTYYLKQLNDFLYSLYTDAKLTVPSVGNGVQTGTGSIAAITQNRLLFMPSDFKGTILQAPTVTEPFFQQSKLLCKILPSTETCTAITLDYMRKPPRFIDVADTVIDYSNYYPLQFQYSIIAETAKLFAFATRDGSLAQGEQEQIITNP